MTLLVRNEAEVIEENLVYHLESGVDFVIATDNGSTDGTLDVLERYAREGHLHLGHEASREHRQETWVSTMARLAATDFGADWVINSDADEFWLPLQGTLKEVLAAVPERFGALKVPRSDFIVRPDGPEPFYDRMTVAHVTTVNPRKGGRPLLAKVIHRAAPDAALTHGNHRVSGTGVELMPGWEPIEILHYPTRSYAQFERKIRQHGEAIDLRRAGQDEAAPASTQTTSESGFTKAFRRLQAGELQGDYEAGLLDDAAVEEGVRGGRLAPDGRLQRFFVERRARAGGSTPPDAAAAVAAPLTPAPPADPARVEELTMAALRAADRHRRAAAVVERDLDKLGRAVQQADRRAARAAKAEAMMSERLERVEGSRAHRLVNGAAAAAARLRRGAGSPPAR